MEQCQSLRRIGLLVLAVFIALISASQEEDAVRALALDKVENGLIGRTSDGSSQDDFCWNQWASYWNASSTTSTLRSTKTYNLISTATVLIRSKISVYTTTYITVVTATVAPGRSFIVSSETYLDTQSLVYTDTAYSTFPSTIVTTWNSETVFGSAVSKALTTPGCALPSSYPACQSQWDAYLQNTGATSPACTQASINSEQCKSVIYAHGGAGMLAGETAMDFTTSNGSSTWWPADSSFAPGCTLGCQTCAITGSTVRVFYWPPSTATAWENGTLTATMTSRPSGSSDVVVAIVDNSTLTSPTVYISYDVLYASNSCSGLGKTYRNTIIPLSKSEDLSSLVYVPYQGQNNFIYSTRLFNFSDLKEPIPDSVYQQLPSCARELQSFSITNFGGSNTSAFTCERHGAYSPIIAVPTEVQNLDAAWKDCTAWYGGLYDPPTALQGMPVAAAPTQPSSPQTITPEPLATVTNDAPKHTMTKPSHTGSAESSSQILTSIGVTDETTATSVAISASTNIAGFIISAINGGLGAMQPGASSDGGSQHIATGDDSHSTETDVHKTDRPHDTGVPEHTGLHDTAQPSALPHTGSSNDVSRPPHPDSSSNDSSPPGETRSRYTATLTLSGQTLTAWEGGGEGVIVDGFSIDRHDYTTINGVAMSLGPDGLVIGSRTVDFGTHTATGAAPGGHAPVLITVKDSSSDSNTLTAIPISGRPKEVAVDGMTLSQGASPTIIDGIRMSLGEGGILYTLPLSSTADASSVASASGPSTERAFGSDTTSVSLTSTSSIDASAATTSGASNVLSKWRSMLMMISGVLVGVMCT